MITVSDERKRAFRRFLWVMYGMATLAALFYLEEYARGRYLWHRYQVQMEARGEPVNFEAYIPAPVNANSNFAQTPFLAPLYDFCPGTQQWRDTNGFQKTMAQIRLMSEMSNKRGFKLGDGNFGRWDRGERTDLIALLGTNKAASKKASSKMSDPVTFVAAADMRPRTVAPSSTVDEYPTNQEAAARIILDIIEKSSGSMLTEVAQAREQRPVSRFNILYDYIPVCNIVLPHLSSVKSITTRLSYRSCARLTLGQTNEAFSDLMLAESIADSVTNEPFHVSQMVRMASRALCQPLLWEGLAYHQWTEAQLQQVQALHEKDDFISQAIWVCKSERAFSTRLIDQIRTRAGNIRVHELYELDDTTWMARLIPNCWYAFEQLEYSRVTDAFLQSVDQWRRGQTDMKTLQASLIADGQPAASKPKWPEFFQHRLFVSMSKSSTSKIFQKALYAQVRSDQFRLACALERYYLSEGQYPEKLADVQPRFIGKIPHDLMSGKDFIYHRESPKNYVLYSVGADLKNDGGNPAKSVAAPSTPETEKDWILRI
jgi:hypothetical protein